MGVPWIFESIHHLSHGSHQPEETLTLDQEEDQPFCNSGSEIFFRIVSVFYFSRGFFMFLIFACNNSVWRKLKKTFILRKVVQNIEMRQARRDNEGNVLSFGFVKSAPTQSSIVAPSTQF